MNIETGKKFVRERNYLEAEKIFLNLLNKDKKDKDLMLVNYFLDTNVVLRIKNIILLSIFCIKTSFL